MASNVFTIRAQKNVSSFLICKMIVIPNIFLIRNLPFHKGKKISCQKQPYLRVLKKNEMIETEPPCSIQQQNVI